MSTPPFAANNVVLYDDVSLLWKDNIKTISATAPGDVVNVIQDSSGNNNDATILAGRTGAILQPTYTNGKRAYLFSTSNVYSLGVPAALVATLNTTSAWTLFCLGNSTNINGYIFSKASGGAGRVNFGIWQGAVSAQTAITGSAQIPLTSPITAAFTPLDTTYSKAQKIFLNGVPDASNPTALPAADVTNPIGFGGQGGNPTNYAFQGSINVLAVFNRILHDPELMQLSDYYLDYYGIPNPRKSAPFYVFFVANSISMNPGGAAGNVPTKLQTTLGLPQGALINSSVPGKSGTQIIAEAPTNIWPYLNIMREGKPLVYCGYEITNESALGQAAGINSLQAATAAKQQGFDKAITATTTPGQTVGVMQPANAYVRANWLNSPYNVDALVDLASDPVAGNPYNFITGGYYCSDGLHPNVNGVTLLANLWAPKLKAVAYLTNCVRVVVSALTTTTCTVTCSAPAYGTGPYNVQFQQAPDNGSGQPGAWASIGTNTTALSIAVTGLVQNTPYWFRAVTVDTNSTRIATTLWETATTTAAAATGYTITGPTAGASGVASSLYTVTPNGAVSATDSVSLTITGGGSCTPGSLSFPSGSIAPLTFYYTPTTTGAKSISVVSVTLGLVVTGNPISYTSNSAVATGYFMTGPNTGPTAVASGNFGFTPDGIATDTLTLPTASGTWTPTTLTWAGAVNTQTATFTPTGTGTKALVFSTAVSSSALNFKLLGFGVIGGWYYYSQGSAVTYTLSGPNSMRASRDWSVYTVTPSGVVNDTVILTDDNGDGLFNPAILTFVNTTAVPQTVAYLGRTVSALGKMRAQSASFLPFASNPVTANRTNLVANSSWSISGPLSGVAGVTSANFILIPNGTTVNDTITFGDGGQGGVFNPPSLTQINAATIMMFTYTPPYPGVFQLTLTSSTPITVAGNGFLYTATASGANTDFVDGGFVL